MGMGSSVNYIPEDVHFVIIGAGYAGIAVARALRDTGAKFTIINEKDAFHHNIGAVRAAAVKGMLYDYVLLVCKW